MPDVAVRSHNITATGNIVVNDLGFAPKAVKAYAAHNAADGASGAGTDAMLCLGFGTYRGGSVQQCYQTLTDDDAAATSVMGTGRNNTALLKGLTVPTASTVGTDYEIDLVSLDANGYTLNVADAPALSGFRIIIVAIGGADVTDALAFNFATSAAVGTQDVTVTSGFGQPDLLELSMGGAGQAIGDLASHAYFSLGVAGKSNLNGRNTCLAVLDNAGTMDMEQRQTAVLLNRFNATPAFVWSAVLSSTGAWPTDGFELTYTGTSTVEQVIGLALKGTFSYTITTTTVPRSGTPPVNRDITHSEAPKLGMVWGGIMPANAGTTGGDVSSATFGGYVIGVTDGTNERFVGYTQDDGNTASQAGSQYSDTKTVRIYAPAATSATLQAEADGSFNGNDFRLAWNDIDSTPSADRELNVLILGGATAPAASGSSSVSGGGATAATGAKGATASSSSSGGGAAAATGAKAGAGVSTVAGGGAATTVGAKDTYDKSGSSSVSGGGSVTSSAAKGAAGASSATGGGASSSSGAKGAAGVSDVSGGGTGSGTGQEGALSTGAVSGGGSVETAGAKNARGTSSVSGGGSVSSVGTSLVIDNRNGTSSVSGGGAVTSSGAKTGQAASASSGGGAATSSGRKDVTGTSEVAGGGNLTAIAVRSVTGTSSVSGGGDITGTAATGRASASLVSGGGFVVTFGTSVQPAQPPTSSSTGAGGSGGKTRAGGASGRTRAGILAGSSTRAGSSSGGSGTILHDG